MKLVAAMTHVAGSRALIAALGWTLVVCLGCEVAGEPGIDVAGEIDENGGEPGSAQLALTPAEEDGLQAVTEALTGVVTISDPVANASAMLTLGQDAADAPDAHDAPRAGEVGCITYNVAHWAVSIDFDQCIVPTTGMLVDGTIALGLAIEPIRITASFDALLVGDLSLDGSLDLTITPNGGNFVGDITITNAEGTVTLDELSVDVAPNSVIVDGAGSIETVLLDAGFDAENLSWEGQCLPESGFLTLRSGERDVMLEFLPTTPEDGQVIVYLGDLPPFSAPVFPACP